MKKFTLFAMLFAGCLQVASADELPTPSKEVVQLAIDDCKTWAEEDEVSENQLYNYVLKCVNETLADQEFTRVTKIEL